MELSEIKNKLLTTEYDFLRSDTNLGSNIILLGLGGSHAYGMETETSDIDISTDEETNTSKTNSIDDISKLDDNNDEEEAKPIKNEKLEIPLDIGALGRQIIKICEAYDIYCAIYDSTASILTAAGGWKFDYTKRPIKLYHQNYKTMKGTKENTEYHLQNGEYYSPIDAIAYIIKHDNKRIKMMLKEIE